jgi:ubiquinone biosynthesis protein
MHPGNIFVNPDRPENPQYLAVDFGIMGSLNPADQHYLAFNILAFFHRDYRKIAELHIESGWVAEDTRIDEFESAIRTVCEPIFEKPLKEISFGRTLMRLFQTGRKFNMQVQPQLVLLQKTLLHIEGLGRKLYPDLDLWKTAKPHLENWMQQRTGLASLFKKSYANLPYWIEQLPEIPTLTYEALQAIKSLTKSNIRKKTNNEKIHAKFKRIRLQSLFTGLGLGLVLAAAYIYLTMRVESSFNWDTILILGISAIVMLLLALLFSK